MNLKKTLYLYIIILSVLVSCASADLLESEGLSKRGRKKTQTTG